MVTQRLNEGVTPKNLMALTAYMITVAEEYEKAPLHDATAAKAWKALNKSNVETLMKRLTGKIEVRYTADDPYANYTNDPAMMVKYMLYDMVVNRQLVVFSGSSEHPVFSQEDNLAFRAVHDFYAHGKVRTAFFEQLKTVARAMKLKALPDISQAHDLLKRVDMSKFGNRGFLFNGRGELNAAAAHIRLAPREAAPALFCEVVGQVSYQIITGEFGVQKVAILPGFDYNKLGSCVAGSPQQQRLFALLKQMNSGIEEIQTSVGTLNTSETMNRVKMGVA